MRGNLQYLRQGIHIHNLRKISKPLNRQQINEQITPLGRNTNRWPKYEGKKNLPPQNISLACRLFEAGDNSSEDSGRTFDLPLKLPKETQIEDLYQEGSRCLEASNSHEAVDGKSWPIVSAGASKPLFSKQLLVHLLRTTFLPFEALFCLQLKVIFKGFGHFGSFGSPLCVQVITLRLTFCC